jgi:hypothetical protein
MRKRVTFQLLSGVGTRSLIQLICGIRDVMAWFPLPLLFMQISSILVAHALSFADPAKSETE